MALFRESLPVIVLDAGVARTPAALQSTPVTPLLATLERRSAADELVFTLSDLGNRLLLLSTTLTPTSYAALRDAQALRVDYAGFPRELAELLRTPAADNNYILVLSLGERHKFEVVQLSQFRLLAHIELGLQPASSHELLLAVAKRASEMDTIAKAAVRSENDTKARLATTERLLQIAENARVELEALRPLADACNIARAELDDTKHDAAEARREAADARARADVAEQARTAAERARDAAAAGADAEARRAVNELATEVRKANTTIERLRDELRTARERERVAGAIMERQESKVAELEKKVKDGDVRRGEMDSLKRRLKAAEKQVEENAVYLASDRETIAFLNRELNRRDALMATPTPERFKELAKKGGGSATRKSGGGGGTASATPVAQV